jgi:hypothetical protein
MAINVAALALLVLGAPAHAAVIQGRNTFLAADSGSMRPEVVARTLQKVEEEWKSQAAVFVECNASVANSKSDCGEAPASFTKSCARVVSAIVQGSNGNRQNAKEYLNNVCGQNVLVGWQKLRCTEFALAIVSHGMVADDYANREHLRADAICSGYWSQFVVAEQKREAEEEIERAQEVQRKAKEVEEAKKKDEEKAKIEAQKHAEEEAKRKKELQEREAAEAKANAAEAAAEAKLKAAEAADRLAQKKADALKIQKEAEQKAKEAELAEKENLEALAKHQQAQALLRNATDQAVAKAPVVVKSAAKNSTEPKQVAAKEVAPKAAVGDSHVKLSNTTNSTKAEAAVAQKVAKVAAANSTK